MFDPTEYRNACGGLRLSREKLEEIMKTTEQNRQKKRRASVRTALVAAALCAALAVSAGAAYPNALEAILAGIRSRTPVGDYREELVLDNGERVTALREVGAYVEEREDRVILTVDGEETDITEELARDGEYLWTHQDQGAKVQVRVWLDETGHPWLESSLTAAEGEDGSGMVTVTEYGGE